MDRMDRIDVVRPGSRVGLRVPEIPDAQVVTVQVKAGGFVTYEVCWWSGGDRYSAWVEAFELELSPAERASIGFVRQP